MSKETRLQILEATQIFAVEHSLDDVDQRAKNDHFWKHFWEKENAVMHNQTKQIKENLMHHDSQEIKRVVMHHNTSKMQRDQMHHDYEELPKAAMHNTREVQFKVMGNHIKNVENLENYNLLSPEIEEPENTVLLQNLVETKNYLMPHDNQKNGKAVNQELKEAVKHHNAREAGFKVMGNHEKIVENLENYNLLSPEIVEPENTVLLQNLEESKNDLMPRDYKKNEAAVNQELKKAVKHHNTREPGFKVMANHEKIVENLENYNLPSPEVMEPGNTVILQNLEETKNDLMHHDSQKSEKAVNREPEKAVKHHNTREAGFKMMENHIKNVENLGSYNLPSPEVMEPGNTVILQNLEETKNDYMHHDSQKSKKAVNREPGKAVKHHNTKEAGFKMMENHIKNVENLGSYNLPSPEIVEPENTVLLQNLEETKNDLMPHDNQKNEKAVNQELKEAVKHHNAREAGFKVMGNHEKIVENLGNYNLLSPEVMEPGNTVILQNLEETRNDLMHHDSQKSKKAVNREPGKAVKHHNTREAGFKLMENHIKNVENLGAYTLLSPEVVEPDNTVLLENLEESKNELMHHETREVQKNLIHHDIQKTNMHHNTKENKKEIQKSMLFHEKQLLYQQFSPPSMGLHSGNDFEIWISDIKRYADLYTTKTSNLEEFFSHWHNIKGKFHLQLNLDERKISLEESVVNMAKTDELMKAFWPFSNHIIQMNQKLFLNAFRVSVNMSTLKTDFYDVVKQLGHLDYQVENNRVIYDFDNQRLLKYSRDSGLIDASDEFVKSGKIFIGKNEQKRVQNRTLMAIDLIKKVYPELYDSINSIITYLVFYRSENPEIIGGSLSSVLGMVWVNPDHVEKWSTELYAELIVHELIHQNIYFMEMVHGLFNNHDLLDKAKVYSSVRREKRSFHKSLHAAYVTAGVTIFDARANYWSRAVDVLKPLSACLQDLLNVDNKYNVLNVVGKNLLYTLEDFKNLMF